MRPHLCSIILAAAVTACTTVPKVPKVTSIGVTDPTQVVHIASGAAKLRIVSFDNRPYAIEGKNSEYIITSPGEHIIELQMFGYYQSTSNAKVKIRAKAGEFVMLCPMVEIALFANAGSWGILPISRPSLIPPAARYSSADGYSDYSVQCAPWTSVVEEQDPRPLAPGQENYWKTTIASRDFRDPEGRSVVELAKRLQKPNRAAQLADAGY